MRLALAQARHAALAGEIPVGALVLSDVGDILFVAENCMESAANPCAHAEMLAIQGACRKRGGRRLSNCVLVSTLEPCLMCAAAAAHAHIAGIVYGAADPQAGAISSATDFMCLPLANRHIWHMGGVLGEECAELLNGFFAGLRQSDSNWIV